MKTKAPVLCVSRKFYDNLLNRVDEILKAVFSDPDPIYSRQVKRLIVNYLNDRLDTVPDAEIYPEARIIFLTLKAEIDRARQRSLSARRAARHRAALRRKTSKPAQAKATGEPAAAMQEGNIDGQASLSTAPTPSQTPATYPPSTLPGERNRQKRTGLKWKPATTPRHKSIRMASRLKNYD